MTKNDIWLAFYLSFILWSIRRTKDIVRWHVLQPSHRSKLASKSKPFFQVQGPLCNGRFSIDKNKLKKGANSSV
jgi:hypothetical protein